MDWDIKSIIETLTNMASLEQENVIVFVASAAIVYTYIYTKIRNVANVEQVFMKPKKRKTNEFLLELVLLGLFIVSKAITICNVYFLAIEILFFFIASGVLMFALNRRLKFSIKGYSANEIYEISKFLMVVIGDSIVFLLLSAITEDSVSKFVWIILAGATDLIILRIIESQLMENNCSVCFFDENKQTLYVYKKIDNDVILCGDKPKINEATMVKMIDYDMLKKQEFLVTHSKKVQKS
mgnify:CR=1 FL=1